AIRASMRLVSGQTDRRIFRFGEVFPPAGRGRPGPVSHHARTILIAPRPAERRVLVSTLEAIPAAHADRQRLDRPDALANGRRREEREVKPSPHTTIVCSTYAGLIETIHGSPFLAVLYACPWPISCTLPGACQTERH